MPKQWLQINDFSGGMVNAIDSRDIKANESPKIENFILDKRKSLTTFGGERQHQDIPSGDSIVICPGFGMFVYDTDHQRGIIDKDSQPPVWRNARDDGENWMAVLDSSSGKVFLYDNSSKIVNQDYNDGATTPLISIGTPNSFNVGTYTDSDSKTISRLQFLSPHAAFIFPTTINTAANFKNPDGNSSDWWFKPGDIVSISGCNSVEPNNVSAARIKSVTPIHFGDEVDTNMILDNKNSDMTASTDWVGYGSTESVAQDHSTDTTVGSEIHHWLNRLKIENTADTDGGVKLGWDYFAYGGNTIESGNTYFVAVTMVCVRYNGWF